jgi:hypothetical protein
MISEILGSRGFNTLVYDDAYAKICLIASLISEFQNQDRTLNGKKKILYLDLDVAFTAYVKAGLIPSMDIRKVDNNTYQSESNVLRIYLPSEDTFDVMVIDIIKSINDP